MKLFELQASSMEKDLTNVAKRIGDNDDPQSGMNPKDPNNPGEQQSLNGMQGDTGTGDPGMGGPGGPGGAGDMGMDAGMGGPPMGGPGGQNSPETPDFGQSEEEQSQQLMKKVDQFLVTAMKNHPFVSDYRHRPDSKISPYAILQMDNSELMNLRTIARNKLGMLSYSDKFGSYDDPGNKFYQDLIGYVERLIAIKKETSKKARPTPHKVGDPSKVGSPKTKPGAIKP